MPNYLILNFRNAGLFRKHRNTKDKMFDIYGRWDRKDSEEFIEPITVHQVSNMLHVLFGERPKPTNRDTLYGRSEYLFNKANESYLRIDSYKDANGKFYTEKIQTKKSVSNSWNPVSYMNWNRVFRLLERDLYEKFTSVVEEVFNIKIEDVPMVKLKPMILESDDQRLKDVFDFLNKNGKKPLHSYFYGTPMQATEINMNKRTTMTVLRGLDGIIRLDGQLIVPVTDEDVECIKRNKGCATILDNGMVTIKGIQSENSITILDFTKIKDISLEKC